MQVSATCPPLKCVFINFFAETPFFLGYLPENQPLRRFDRLICGIPFGNARYSRLNTPGGEKSDLTSIFKTPRLTYDLTGTFLIHDLDVFLPLFT